MENRKNINNSKGYLVKTITGKMVVNKGFTLIEVLASMAILSIGLVSLMSLSVTSVRSKEMGKRQTIAINIAAEKIEFLKTLQYNNVNIGSDIDSIERECTIVTANTYFTCEAIGTAYPSKPVETHNGLKFTWWWDVRYIDLDDDGVTNEEDSTNIEDDDVKLITVYVTWDDAFGTHKISLKTLRYRLG